jgi:Flp pilus assembly protein TadG
MVELALVAPVLLLLILGIVYFGRYMNYGTDATHLANEAARWAAVNDSPANIDPSCASSTLAACVQNQTNSTSLKTGTGDVSQKLKVCISFPQGATQGKAVEAEVTANFNLLPILGGLSLPIDVKAYMPLEQTPTNYTAGCSS